MNRKELTSFRMINWHKCSDSGILKLDGDTLLTGGTGSGKSSLLDGLYLVLTLNEHNFNKASGENAKRDLRSYVRCRIDENVNGKKQKYQRKGKVISYLLAEIYDAKNNVSVLGTCFVSTSDTSDIEKHYFVINDTDLEEVNLIDENRCPLDFKAFQSQFEIYNFHSPKTKGDAKKLFAQVIGFKKDQVDLYEKWGSVYSKIMSGKSEITNVDSFIKNNILRNSTLDIESMELILRDLNELTERLEEYEKRQEQLEVIKEKMEYIDSVKEQVHKNDALYIVANYEHLQIEIEKTENMISSLQREHDSYEKENEELSKKRDSLKEQKFKLENMDEKQQLSQFIKEKELLEKQLSNSESEKKSILLKINQFYDLFDKYEVLSEIFEFPYELQDLNKDNINKFLDKLDSLQELLLDCLSKENTNIKNIQYECESLRKETNELKLGSAVTNIATGAVKAINKYFKDNWIQDEAKSICEYLDFKTDDNMWKSTLESYLGNVRFYIIVKPENYQIAKQIVKNGSYYNVSVVDNTDDFDRISRDGSICDLFTYSNEYAEQFIKYKYGGIMAIETCLDGVPDSHYHYLGKDGTTYGGRVFSLKNTKIQHHIGRAAKTQLIEENENMLTEYAEHLKNARNNVLIYDEAKNIIRKLISQMNNLNRSIFDDVVQLPIEIESLNAAIRDLTNEDGMFDSQKKINEIQSRIDNCDAAQKLNQRKQMDTVKQLGVKEEKRQECNAMLETIKPQYFHYQEHEFNVFSNAQKEYANILLDSRKSIQSVSKSLELEKQKMETQLDELNKQLVVLQKTYCDLYNSALSFAGIESKNEFYIEYEKIALRGVPELKKSVSIKKDEEVSSIKSNVMKFFKRGFDETDQIINNLNKSLKDVAHGGKTYVLTQPIPSPGFEKFYQLIVDTEIAGYFGNGNVEHSDEEYEEFYDFVRSNVDYQDYRNYIQCDVAVKKYEDGRLVEKRLSDSLSVSSGGEKQVPLYILSAMSMLSIYVTDRTNDVLRFVALDEAFSFIDASHTESVLGYFDAIDLQLIIGVPDRMAKLFQEYTDNQIYVTNKGGGRIFKALNSQRKFVAFNRMS